jgi:HSP20 family protein
MLRNRWDPFVEMNRLRNEMDRLFGRWGVNQPSGGNGAYPPLNVWGDDDRLYVEAELPGLDLGDLEIFVTGGNQLTINGERKQPQLEGGAWHRQERGFGTFTRTIELPHQVNSDQVSAEFKAGVLTVSCPKAEEVKPRRIEVKVS